ncbi:type III secretion system gatekeeper subunit SctW [Acerihabitans sp. TG2]|uniref:type III secretion system gatekeeper subunit SctW n=1 Tax=Acerihabitans sp. TG2 TaxID=3096008 RepID=UPI002B223116|nr:type III secretion system gatekeeper subunit SctW [Acerihabitans sp. TG2]MEA9389622.1 type III secretion system gatekeeper subunit SctW [Acerihabitans sp. TG2]
MAIAPISSAPSFPVASDSERSSNQKTKAAFKQKLTASKSVNAKVAKQAQSSAKASAGASQFIGRRQSDKNASEEWSSEFQRVLEDDGSAKAKALLKVSANDNMSLALLLNQARSLFPDDSDLVMVLRELLRQRNLNEKLKTLLKAVLKDVEDNSNPRDVKAGINCGIKARLFGQKHLDLKPILLRASYRRFLENEQDGMEEYQDWIACYGYLLRSVVLDFIEAALLADIDSQDPSCSCIEFGGLIGKLGQLKLLRSGDSLFTKKLVSLDVIDHIGIAEPDWLIMYFSLLAQPQAIGEHLNVLLGETFLLFSHHERAKIIQVIYRSCKLLPHELFDNVESVHELLYELERLLAITYQQELIEKRRAQ